MHIVLIAAGASAAEVVFGLTQGHPAPRPRVDGIIPLTIVLAVYLAAFLTVTRRDGGLPRRTLLIGTGFGVAVALLFAASVPVLPPGLVWWVGFLLIAAAAVTTGRLTRPAEVGVTAALFTTAAAGQALYAAAAILYRYGPDAWMPYAGPGPLTAQGQLEQNRAEAIEPYVGLFLLGAVAATIVTVQAVNARLRLRQAAAPTTLRPRDAH